MVSLVILKKKNDILKVSFFLNIKYLIIKQLELCGIKKKKNTLSVLSMLLEFYQEVKTHKFIGEL